MSAEAGSRASPIISSSTSLRSRRVTVELGNFIAALREADLVGLKWGERGMLCGNPLLANPTVLTLIVADEGDA